MRNAGRSRLMFLLVLMLIVAAGVAMIGNTFADQVAYSGNEEVLVDSDFAVDVAYYNKDAQDYVSMVGTNVAAFTENMLWSPGKTEIIYLRIKNNETFPVNCTLSLHVAKSEFDDKMEYAVIDNLLPGANGHPTNWGDFVAQSMEEKEIVLSQCNHTLLSQCEHTLLSKQLLNSGQGYHDLALAIHMDESTTYEYMNKRMEFKFVLRVDADYTPAPTSTPASKN